MQLHLAESSASCLLSHQLGDGKICFGGVQRVGRIHAAAFSDEVLYAEMVNKASFWVQPAYFGIDLTPLYSPALAGYFAQVPAVILLQGLCRDLRDNIVLLWTVSGVSCGVLKWRLRLLS